ncbi:hypothetical protein [Blastopirellula marina]|uniref:DUF4436 domain-containing protein n=1 Tax=Blastopirellula marina TaxID=124 RepID=A0A2S8FD29_9BACT|nr:hypothetical protein [Blastopirellula marina]PQO30065.1 hypothetical protein C5Y98_21140 [Blastopirellula marina]PTL42503.1 hypothetical protein C5Y97_21150 [Blastopirellula marina]
MLCLARFFFLFPCVFLIAAVAPAGEFMVNNEQEITYTVPNGFVRIKDREIFGIKIFDEMIQRDRGDGAFAARIFLQRMEKPTTPDSPLSNGLVEVYDGKPYPVAWKSFDLKEAVTRIRVADDEAMLLTVDLPILPDSIRVGVVGPLAKADECQEILESFISTVDGDVSWQVVQPPLSPNAKKSTASSNQKQAEAAAPFFILGIIIGSLVLFALTRCTPRGTVCLIGIFLLGLSYVLVTVPSFPVQVLGSVFRLVGPIGCVIGIVDFVWRSKKRPTTDGPSAGEPRSADAAVAATSESE